MIFNKLTRKKSIGNVYKLSSAVKRSKRKNARNTIQVSPLVNEIDVIKEMLKPCKCSKAGVHGCLLPKFIAAKSSTAQ